VTWGPFWVYLLPGSLGAGMIPYVYVWDCSVYDQFFSQRLHQVQDYVELSLVFRKIARNEEEALH
jgi:hypothetical protein